MPMCVPEPPEIIIIVQDRDVPVSQIFVEILRMTSVIALLRDTVHPIKQLNYRSSTYYY